MGSKTCSAALRVGPGLDDCGSVDGLLVLVAGSFAVRLAVLVAYKYWRRAGGFELDDFHDACRCCSCGKKVSVGLPKYSYAEG